MKREERTHNFSYPSSAAAVVFGVYLSAQTVSRLDRKSPAIRRPACSFLRYKL